MRLKFCTLNILKCAMRLQYTKTQSCCVYLFSEHYCARVTVQVWTLLISHSIHFFSSSHLLLFYSIAIAIVECMWLSHWALWHEHNHGARERSRIGRLLCRRSPLCVWRLFPFIFCLACSNTHTSHTFRAMIKCLPHAICCFYSHFYLLDHDCSSSIQCPTYG